MLLCKTPILPEKEKNKTKQNKTKNKQTKTNRQTNKQNKTKNKVKTKTKTKPHIHMECMLSTEDSTQCSNCIVEERQTNTKPLANKII